MATTIATLNTAKIEMAVQAALKNKLVPVNAFSVKAEMTGKVSGNTSYVPVLGTPTSQVKTLGTAVTPDGSITGKLVTLNTPREASFSLIEGKIAPEDLQMYVEGLGKEATFAVCKDIIDTALALVTASNYATKHTVAAADFGMNDLGIVFQKAEDLKLSDDRSLILNAGYASQLFGESTLGLVLATLGDQALKTAVLPPLMGMKSYMYAGLPANSENLGGIVVDRRAIAVAIAPWSTFGQGGDTIFDSLVTEPDSGITVNLRMIYNGDGGYLKVNVSALFGVAKVQDAIVRIVTA